MRLKELRPQFLRRIDDIHFARADDIDDADGLLFLCPKCYVANDRKTVGVHSVICWDPSVPQTTNPKGGRWALLGHDFEDLTLEGSSNSILLTAGCEAHFFIGQGNIRMS